MNWKIYEISKFYKLLFLDLKNIIYYRFLIYIMY